jgi:hypothetical protein
MLLRLFLLTLEVTVARVGFRWSSAAWVGLAASCAFGTAACSDETSPTTEQDAAVDTGKPDTRPDTSVGPDVSSDTSVTDQREAGAPDTSAEGGAPDVRTDGGMPDGGNCVGGGDAARDGLAGMALVAQLGCARCHQDEPVDAGLILSGKMTTSVPDAGVFPKNLTPDPATGLGCWTDDQIINAFMNGIDDQGQTLCSRMPLYRTRVDGGMPQQIVDFLRSIPAVNKAIPDTTVCPPLPEAGPPDVADGGATDGSDGGGAPDTTGADATDAATDGALDAGSDVAPDAGNDGASTDVENDGG